MRHTPPDQLPRIDRWALQAAKENNTVTVAFLAGLRLAEQLLEHIDIDGPYRADTVEACVFRRGLFFALKAVVGAESDTAPGTH